MNKRLENRKTAERLILAAIRSHNGWVGAVQLAKQLGLSPHIVTQRLRQLVVAGRITEKIINQKVPYRGGGQTTRRYREGPEPSGYPAWFGMDVKKPPTPCDEGA